MNVFNSISRDIQYVAGRLPLDGTSETLANVAIEIVAKVSKEGFLFNCSVRDIVIAAIYAASRKIGVPVSPLQIKEAYDDKAIWNNSWTKTLELIEKF